MIKLKKLNWILAFSAITIVTSSIVTTNQAFAGATFTVLGVANYAYQATLNNDDAYIFRNNLTSNANWTLKKEYYDDSVWDTDFPNWGKYSDILFYTGHGDTNGDLMLKYNGGNAAGYERLVSANWNTIGTAWNGWDDVDYHDFEWAVFAACNVLQQNRWGNVLANGGHHLFGYFNVSSELKDQNVINEFQRRMMGVGYTPQTMINAWKNANIISNEPNWAIMGHKQNENDYFHFVSTGPTADVSGTSDIYRWSPGGAFLISVPKSATPTIGELKKLGKLEVEHEKLDESKIVESIFKGDSVKKTEHASYDSTVYSNGKADLQIYPSGAVIYEASSSSSSPLMFEEEHAIILGKQFIEEHGGMPEGAYLENVVPHYAISYDTGESYIYAYQLNFAHDYEGVKISGDTGDTMRVIVDSNGVNLYFRDWKNVKSKINGSEKEAVTGKKALDVAKDSLKYMVKSSKVPIPKHAELVYYSKPYVDAFVDSLIPAWKITTYEGATVYIDAETALPINEEPIFSKFLNVKKPEKYLNPQK